jgi:hypothetical protein
MPAPNSIMIEVPLSIEVPIFFEGISPMPAPSSTQSPVKTRFSPAPSRIASAPATSGSDHATSRWSSSAKAAVQMQRYNELIERLVRYLMQEGRNYVEAYDEVLAVSRFDPRTTPRDFGPMEPNADREALLGFKAYNAIGRLQRHYAELLNKYTQLAAS